MDDDQEKPGATTPDDETRRRGSPRDDRERGGDPTPADERRRLIDQRREARLSRAEREQRSRGQQVARKPVEPPPTTPPSAPPPTEATPFSWLGTLEPERVWLELRRARKRRLLLRVGIFCGLPTLFTLFYMLFFASPRYVAEFEITYQSYNPPQNLQSGLVQNLFGSNATNGALDLSDILDEYIVSTSLLERLNHELDLRAYYSSTKVDWLSRMNPNASINTFRLYYNWYVSVSQSNGYLTVDVQAFDPDYSLKLAKAIFKASDEMVNQLTTPAARDEVRSAETEVRRAAERVRKTRRTLADFQNAHGDFNPQGSADQLSGIVGQIEGNLAAERGQLAMLTATAPHSPQIMVTKANIVALEAQLKQERYRLANNGAPGTAGLPGDQTGVPYSNLMDQYTALQLDEQTAQSAFKAAEQGLEVAQADAAHQQNYLIEFAPPYKPDSQRLRFAFWYSLAVLTISLALFSVGSLIAGAMRDQSVQ